jgi:NADPH-dependent 2,4-dienoyl-CoA reductase/sulfur reductase-like enzyme
MEVPMHAPIPRNGRLVVVGGDAAGMSAASRARRLRPDIEIVVLERGYDVSYSACSLPYYIEGLIEHRDDLIAVEAEEFRRKRNIDVRLGAPALAVDAEGRRVVYATIEDETTREVGYDALVIGTGATAVVPSIPGIELPGVFTLRTIPDADRIKLHLKREGVRRAVVAGGGYIGLEVAGSLRGLGLEVTLVELAPRILGTYDEDMARLVTDELERNGVRVMTGAGVSSFEGDEHGLRSLAVGDERLEADIAVVGVGVRPEVALAETAGLALGETGAIRVDERQRTSHERIFAGGDCAEHYHVVTGRPEWIPLGQTANKQGRVAGTNAAGGDARFAGVAGTNVSKVFGLEVAGTGLSEAAAADAGLEFESVRITSRSRSHAYPGGSELDVKLVFERGSGRVLGAQLVGAEGAAKRVDSVATALFAGMTVAELASVDMSYAPPFSPVWDPVLIAASQAAKKVG